MRPVRPCGDVDCPCQGGSGLDTLAAVHARAVAAEQRVAALAAELAALRGGTAPRGPLAATDPGHTPVPGIPGTAEAQERSQPLVPAWVTQTMDAHAAAARKRMRKVQGLMHDGRVVTYEIATDEEPTDD